MWVFLCVMVCEDACVYCSVPVYLVGQVLVCLKFQESDTGADWGNCNLGVQTGS